MTEDAVDVELTSTYEMVADGRSAQDWATAVVLLALVSEGLAVLAGWAVRTFRWAAGL